MPHLNIVFWLLVGAASCQDIAQRETDPIINVVGEIFHDDSRDGDFQICMDQHLIVQYYAFPVKTYDREKAAIDQHFLSSYQKVDSDDSGIIRIRFIVNCKGETGRFRIHSMDWNYEPKEFDPKITDQLMTLTKGLNGWKAMEANGQFRDYYQYLLFKIDKGSLIEVMP